MAVPVIPVTNNTSYGPPLVNQKYRPLEFDANAPWNGIYRDTYAALLNNRYNLLKNANLLSGFLHLVTKSWRGIVDQERKAGRLPPLVVISSNRSSWIKAGLAAAKTQRDRWGADFTGPGDWNALTALANQAVSPPIYAPVRIAAAERQNRSIYIVVHSAEYTTYQKALANTGIVVVGWEFKKKKTAAGIIQLCGFGASRYAAIEFCKQLKKDAAWSSAWLIDDNVVGLTSFPGFAAVETALRTADPAVVCAGLRGGTKAEAHVAIVEKARRIANLPVPPLGNSATPAVVQQMALWNIDYLNTNYLNFGPVFVESAEDLSIGKYFDFSQIPYLHYEGIGVEKEETTYDNGDPSRVVKTARAMLAKRIADMESATPRVEGNVPPPLKVNKDGGNAQTISAFIVNTVIPNSRLEDDKKADVNVQNAAKCQATELLTSFAIEKGLVAAGALNNTFKINGASAQAVGRFEAE